MRRNTYEIIYYRLEQLGLNLDNPTDFGKSESSGFMDLNYDYLGFRGPTSDDNPGTFDISLAHYFKQNGDMCADPDMEIRVYPKHKMAEALTFQMAIPPIYQEVYPEPGKVYPKVKAELNHFLKMWLRNCINQGHSFKAPLPTIDVQEIKPEVITL